MDDEPKGASPELEEWEFDDSSDDEDDLFDPDEECGAYTDGRFSYYACRLAGTEFCDFECPNARSARAARSKP